MNRNILLFPIAFSIMLIMIVQTTQIKKLNLIIDKIEEITCINAIGESDE